jgi:hypothetical protein
LCFSLTFIGMGNDWQPPDNLSQKGSTGILSSLVNTVTNVVMGDGTEPVYAGHAGATGSYIGGADKQLAITNPDNRYSNQGSYNAPGGGGTGAPLRRGSSTSATTTYTSSGFAGLGNPNFKDARDEKSWIQKAGEVASNLSTMAGLSGKEGVGPVGSPPYGAAGAGPDGWNYATNRGPNAYGRQEEGYQPNRPMNALGSNATVNYNGWNQPSSSSSAYPSSSSGSGGGVVPDIPVSVGPLGSGKVGGGADDGEYERSLIDALCEPGGLKPIPPEQKLQEFLASATTLSPDVIGNCLLDILCNNEASWQSKIKALIVIANLSLSKNNCPNHSEWWKIPEHHDQIRILCNDTKASVRTQAAKTLKIVSGIHSSTYPASSSSLIGGGDGGEEYAPPTSSSANSLKTTSGKQDPLLDLLDDDINPVASLPVSTNNSPMPSQFQQYGMKSSPMTGAAGGGGGGGMDLFSGMSIGGTTPKNISDDPVNPSLSPFSSSSQLVNNPPPLSLSSNSTDNSSFKQSQQQQPLQQPIKTINISEHFDFLNDDAVVSTPPPPPPQQVQQPNNLFDNLNISSSTNVPKSSSSTSYQDDFAALSLNSAPATTASSSSSFGFLNNNSTNNGNMNTGGMMSMPTYRSTPASSSNISNAFMESNTNPNKNSNDKAFSQVCL